VDRNAGPLLPCLGYCTVDYSTMGWILDIARDAR